MPFTLSPHEQILPYQRPIEVDMAYHHLALARPPSIGYSGDPGLRRFRHTASLQARSEWSDLQD